MSAQRLTLIQFFAAYAVALVVMGALDGIWLGWLAKSFYREQLGALMTDSVRVVPAALYYFGFPLAIVYLALMPAASLGEAVLRSAVLGLAAFGVYDLTNLATLRGYTVLMTVVDMVWGTFATALGGGVAYRLVMASR
jgi:uncharacterized membrane protein